MQTVIIVIHLMVVLALIGAVLLQKSEGGGLGMGGGGGGFLSSRGTANVLTRTTSILAGVFFVTSLMLSIMASLDHRSTSIFGGPTAPGGAAEPANGAIPSAKDILQDLQKPSEPATPSGPQVPDSR